MAGKSKRLPKYRRVTNPPGMRLTHRDRQILEAIHTYDGMLGFSQIKRLFFSGSSQAKERMKLLYQHRYVNRPNREQRGRVLEMIYWLDKRGAEIVAAMNSDGVNEFRWLKTPRWFQVEHDLAVNDFRISMQDACQAHPDVELTTWIPEREFWIYPDTVSYSFQGKQLKRKIRPDGYFMLTTPKHHIRYLLEIDRGTEDNPRFLREKVLPGLEYLKSNMYEKRFGHRAGRWLVITTGKRRMKNMLNQARRGGAEGIFYFTTYNQVNTETLLSAPIWHRADRDDKVPIIFVGN